MQSFTQKYTIVQLLEDMPDGTEYSWKDWPLHVTLADVFAIDWDVSTMIEELTALLERRKPIKTTATGEAYFGPEKQTKVVLLDMNQELLELHYDIIKLLEHGHVKFNTPQFVKEGFVAHSTVQAHARLAIGDTVTFHALSLIDLFPNENPYQRKIVKTMDLGGVG